MKANTSKVPLSSSTPNASSSSRDASRSFSKPSSVTSGSPPTGWKFFLKKIVLYYFLKDFLLCASMGV